MQRNHARLLSRSSLRGAHPYSLGDGSGLDLAQYRLIEFPDALRLWEAEQQDRLAMLIAERDSLIDKLTSIHPMSDVDVTHCRMCLQHCKGRIEELEHHINFTTQLQQERAHAKQETSSQGTVGQTR